MSNGFKSGLNFIQESGTKTVTTFSEGISSGKSVVYNKVIDVLEKQKGCSQILTLRKDRFLL
ncbi:hypothetical protein LEP1GSC170_5276 [Leptospira interrogans serovar Bataviae str. HAI135]|nr:hypothetical protein LEP1GSC170_5276 [Leptospira interrogans serovar Bataviae str. HAI135]